MRLFYNLIYKHILIFLLTACNPMDKCHKVKDVYYYPGKNDWENPEHFSKSMRCDYTLTECEEDCVTTYIFRDHYDRYKKQYTDLGLKYPYPRVNKKPILIPNRY